MHGLVSKILSGELSEARLDLNQCLLEILHEKLLTRKVQITRETGVEEEYEICEDDCEDSYEAIFIDEPEYLEEGHHKPNVTKQGRSKIIRVRVRNGKVQRRKKFSAVKGWTIRGGKLIRMTAAERRHRKLAARKSRFKRKSKMRQSLRKRKMSLRRRHGMGL